MWTRIKNIFLGRATTLAQVTLPDHQDPIARFDRPMGSTASALPQLSSDLPPPVTRAPATRSMPKYRAPLSVRIAGAATNLAETNIEAAKRFGLGSEKLAHLDETSGQLRLVFANGAKVAIPAQLIGYYDQRTRVYDWAWADVSVPGHLKNLSEFVRHIGEESHEPLLAGTGHALDLHQVLPLVAFSAQEGGLPFVYAVPGQRNELRFLALGKPTITSANGRAAESPFGNAAHINLSPETEIMMFQGAEHANQAFVVPHLAGGIIAVIVGEDGLVTARKFTPSATGSLQYSHVADWGRGFLWPHD